VRISLALNADKLIHITSNRNSAAIGADEKSKWDDFNNRY
jgi:hypothetical protein